MAALTLGATSNQFTILEVASRCRSAGGRVKTAFLGEFLLRLSGLCTRGASMRTRVRSLASLSGLKIRGCRELWCRSQLQL